MLYLVLAAIVGFGLIAIAILRMSYPSKPDIRVGDVKYTIPYPGQNPYDN